MLILAIQSSLPIIEIALFSDGKANGKTTAKNEKKNTEIENITLLCEKSWSSNRDEIVKLLPAIEQGVGEAGYKFSDIKKIIVANGPGAFSSTRIGVTIANGLAYSLKAEIYELDTPTYERLFAKIFAENSKEVKNSEKKISLAKIILKYLELNPQAVPQAIPNYSTEAKITPSKKQKFV